MTSRGQAQKRPYGDPKYRVYGEQYPHLRDDVHTPLNTESRALLESAKREMGSWRQLSLATGYRPRVLRRWRNGGGTKLRTRRTISFKIMDELLTAAGIGERTRELTWFTVEQLIDMGIWEPQLDFRLYLEAHPPKKGRRR